jgi:23S rRNA pseudouridine1911/1915/1917 synthase
MAVLRVITADRGDAGKRLDLVLRRHLTDVDAATRTRVQTWIESGRVTVNGTPVRRVAARAARGDVVSIDLPEPAPRTSMDAEDAALQILYEDDHLLAIDKPPGLVVHPAYKHKTGTLMNALLGYARTWPHARRPSIVGRLDKLTSGIVIVAKGAAAHAALQRALASHDSEKDYLAVVYGRVREMRGAIDLRLALDERDRRRVVASASRGAASLTRFERLSRVSAPRVGLALVRCRLVTGRRHQIRVHLAARGWPIVGDPKYGAARWTDVEEAALAATLRAFPRQALHASRVRFTHPFTGERLCIDAPLPHDFSDLIAAAGLSRDGLKAVPYC